MFAFRPSPCVSAVRTFRRNAAGRVAGEMLRWKDRTEGAVSLCFVSSSPPVPGRVAGEMLQWKERMEGAVRLCFVSSSPPVPCPSSPSARRGGDAPAAVSKSDPTACLRWGNLLPDFGIRLACVFPLVECFGEDLQPVWAVTLLFPGDFLLMAASL